jgi:hypothetical protein
MVFGRLCLANGTIALCAPVVYPWYMLWLLPFIGSTSTLPIIIWTLSIIPTYYVWRLRALGRPWLVPDWIMLLGYESVAVAAAIIALLRINTIGRATKLSGPGRMKPTAPLAI